MKFTPQTCSQGKLEAARKLARKRKAFLFGWLLLAIPVAVQAQFNYTTNNGTITITGYIGTDSAVVIPDTINGLVVTSIGVGAFSGSSVTAVSIPNSVTSVGDLAFSGCWDLSNITLGSGVTSIGVSAFSEIGLDTGHYGCPLINVTIPNSVTSIGAHAFDGCGNLTSVTIPDSVTNIGYFAFAYSASLTNIVVDPLNPAFSSVDGVLFNQNQTTLVEYPGGNLGGYTIPNSVTCVADFAFAGCYSLTNVTISNSVTSIGEAAFSDCFGLTSITIPNSVTSIGYEAFYSCSSLTSVTIPNSVTNIGVGAFTYSSLTNITVEPLNSAYSSVDGVLFNQNQTTLVEYPRGKLVGYTIPTSVTSIADSAFAGCYSLTSVTIPNSVTSIGDEAFSGCVSLTNITLGSGVTSIGVSAFSEYIPKWDRHFGCPLIDVTIPNSVTNIGASAFSGCDRLTNVTIGHSVTSIGDSAFAGCSGLTTVTIPNSVTSIGGSAFAYCGLTSVAIPNSVISIGDRAFNGTSLTNVTILGSGTSIGEAAFSYCYNLTSVILGSGVTSIGDDAFVECSSLTRVYFQGNAPSVGVYVFYGDDVTIYYLPGTTGWGSTFDGFPTALWKLPYPLILTSNPSFGVRTNQFGFTVSWATNLNVVVEAATDLAKPIWSPVQTNTLTSGWFYFSDPQWTNYPARFYRLRSQ